MAGATPDIPAAFGGRAFWVDPPRFLAGAYPGDLDARTHEDKVAALLDLGITHVVTLMEDGELSHRGETFRPYAPALEAAGVIVERFPIPDGTAPSAATVERILAAVDAALGGGGRVYLHCWGGRGRTGVVVGCWLVAHGRVVPGAAVAEMVRLRARCADAHVPIPDTAEQIRCIERWPVP